MLYKICLVQIFVYLYAIPFVRSMFEELYYDYSYLVGSFFLLFFIFGGAVFRNKKNQAVSMSKQEYFSIGLNVQIAIQIWSIIYVIISVYYGFINRRIGTENAADLFASIPLILLITFRTFELITPYFFGLFIYQIHKKDKISTLEKITVSIFVIAFIFSGASSSRSQTFFVLAIAIVSVQNVIVREKINGLLMKAFILAVSVVFLVSLTRLMSIDDEIAESYFVREFLTRLDGLEILDKLIDENGISVFGLNLSVILYPIVSSIPFLSAANELKAAALTTVKSNLIFQEFDSLQRDINSFALVDPYYWGGVIGVIVAGFSIGLITRWADRNVGITSNLLYHALSVAIIGNMIYMEREFISMLIGIIRDWFIFYIFMRFFLAKKIDALKVKNRSES